MDDYKKHVEAHKDYLYLFFDKPLQGIEINLGCPPPGTKMDFSPRHRAIFTDIDYQEEEVEQEPLMIEFSL